MTRSNEPLFWSIFSAGGVVTAFLLPGVSLVLSGWFGNTRLRDYDGIGECLSHPVVQAGLVIFIALCLFHAAHRLRFVIFDLGFQKATTFIAFLLYGAAAAGTGLGVFLLFLK